MITKYIVHNMGKSFANISVVKMPTAAKINSRSCYLIEISGTKVHMLITVFFFILIPS